jgi:hypothetical protein
MLRPSFLILAAILAPSTQAQVPTPESVIGHRVGADYKLASWDTIRGYFEKLDKASPRVSVRSLGTSTEGREMIVAEISSEKNIRNLRKLYDYQAKLHDPRKIGGAQEEADILKNAKSTILINCSMHASEVAASQMSMELAYDLATQNDEDTKQILDNCVIQIIASANPDGLDLVRDWYNKTLDTKYEEAPMPWLYQKYVGHDNNRDWWLVSQKETQNVTHYLYNVGYPSLLYDVHQMGGSGARFFVPPFFDPTNPNIDPVISQSIFMMGGHMATELAAAGKQGVIWRAIYDNWWQGGMRTTPQRHNMVAILTEAASARGASPVTVRPDQLRGHDRGLPTYERYVNFPDPWPGGVWRLRDIVDYELIACKSLFRLGARYRDMWVRNHLALSKKQIKLGETEAPYGWYIPAQANVRGVNQLVTSLMRAGVEVHTLAEPRLPIGGSGPGVTFESAEYIVYAAQPYRAHVKDLMEVQVYPDRRVYPGGRAERPYDVAGWTAPLMMGVQMHELKSLPAVGRYRRLTQYPPVTPHMGSPVRSGVRVGLYQPWTASMDEGWTRFVWEQHGVPYTTLHDADIRAGSLRRKFDCIFLPSVSATSIINGTSAERTFPEYAGGLGAQGLAALKAFAEDGGTLVLMDDATGLAERLDLPVKNSLAGLGRDKFFCPGSILRTMVVRKHPLAEGLPDEPDLGVAMIYKESEERTSIGYFADGKAFAVTAGSPHTPTVVATYAQKPLLSGFLLGEEHIAGKAAVVECQYGKGRVILFGFAVQYRGQSLATFPYMWNAMNRSVQP